METVSPVQFVITLSGILVHLSARLYHSIKMRMTKGSGGVVVSKYDQQSRDPV